MIDPHLPEEMRASEAPEGPQATTAPPDGENAAQCQGEPVCADAWPHVVAVLCGDGPAAPGGSDQIGLHRVFAELEVRGWSVRPCAHGGWFAWAESGTAYCAAPEDLRALARQATREFAAACKAEGKGVRAEQKALMAARVTARRGVDVVGQQAGVN